MNAGFPCKNLDTGYIWVRSAEGAEFLPQIQNMLPFQSLELDGNSFVPTHVTAMFPCISSPFRLSYLALVFCNLTDSSIQSLACEVEALGALRESAVQVNECSGDAWRALVPVLRRGCGVEGLHLSCRFRVFSTKYSGTASFGHCGTCIVQAGVI